MLAAANVSDELSLGMFRVALLMKKSDSEIPEQLGSHFNTVLQQARALLENSEIVGDPLIPDAIQLALDMQEWADLRESIGDINSVGAVTPEIAASILNKLEDRFAEGR